AVALLVLDFLEFLDEIVRTLLEPRIAGRRPHVTHRREIMPGDVPGELAALAIPSAVTLLGFWFQPRATTQIKEHAVGFELEQVIRIEILCVFQWSARQPHIRQRQRPGGERNGVCDWAKRVRRLRSLCCRKKS